MWLLSIAMIVLGFSERANARTASVEVDLERDSRTKGLALVAVVAQRTVVIPFDQRPRYYTTKWGLVIPTFAKSGRVIAWNVRAFLKPPVLVIETVEGKHLLQKTFGSDFTLLSLSETCNRIALLKRSGKDYPGAFDLTWSSMDLSTDGFIDRLQTSEANGADWSPDCRFLAYGKGDEIYLFDTKDRTSALLQRGHDPAWSPDGRTIAFRGLRGAVSLMSPSGQIISSALDSHVALGAIRWSPDGKYVSFIENKPLHAIPLFGATTRLAVCRLQDGSCLTAREFGQIRGYYDEFHWILGYQRFCRDCESAEPFN